jgi:hypothetical protein
LEDGRAERRRAVVTARGHALVRGERSDGPIGLGHKGVATSTYLLSSGV